MFIIFLTQKMTYLLPPPLMFLNAYETKLSYTLFKFKSRPRRIDWATLAGDKIAGQ